MKQDLAYTHLQHIKPLDGLRGIAILLVILFHNFDYLPINGVGWVGVDLFFVLSGFLITRILLNTKARKGYFLNFYIKRTLRIFPLYFLFVFGCILCVEFWDIPRLNPIKLYWPYFITYTPNFLFFQMNGFISKFAMGHLWSLAVEEHFYFFWPLLVYMFSKNKLIIVALVIIIASSICGTLMLLNKNTWMVVYTFTPTRIAAIITGSLLAILAVYYNTFLQKIIFPLFIISFLGIAFFYCFLYWIEKVPFDFFLMHPSNTITKSGGWMLLGWAIFFASLIGLSLRKNVLASFFSIRPLTFLGKYSYGIYIFHAPLYLVPKNYIELLLDGVLPSYLLLQLSISFICLFLTIALSVIVFHLYEKRFLNLKRKFEV